MVLRGLTTRHSSRPSFVGLVDLLQEPATLRRGGVEAGRVLIEEYIPGTEVAVEGLMTDGRLRTLALFDKPDPMEGPHFAETLYVTPSRLDRSIQDHICEQTELAARTLGLREGPVHAELRWHDDRAWIVEVAARQIGGLCSRTLQFGAGMSLEELILRHAAKLPIASYERGTDAAGVMMLPVPARGILRAVGGIDAARMTEYVLDLVIAIPAGERVRPLPEGDRYLGFIFAGAPSPELVEKALRQALRQLSIEIAPI